METLAAIWHNTEYRTATLPSPTNPPATAADDEVAPRVGLVDGTDGGKVYVRQLLQQAAAADIKQVHWVQRSAAPAWVIE
jgi:hypothetical protein